jgi:DNA replication protein DnaC
MTFVLGIINCNLVLNVRFFTVSELAPELSTAKAENRLVKELNDLFKSNMIVLDEFGYVPINRESARLLFQTVSESYETRSFVITTNVEFSR